MLGYLSVSANPSNSAMDHRIFIIGGSCHKYQRFCRDKHVSHLLSRQTYACCNKTSVAKKKCLSRQNIFITTKVLLQQNFLSRQAYFCYDKQVFVATKVSLLRQTSVTTKTCLPQQKFWSNKNVCCNETFVITNILLLQQKMCFAMTHFCHDKHLFVATKLLSQQKWHLWQFPPMIDLCHA